MKNEIFELEAAGFTETASLPVLVVPAAPSEIRSNPGLPWHPRSEEEAFQRAYAAGARELELPAERYTDIPKLGLNPVNKYNTPTGLYWYPLGKTEDFAIDRPYRITAELVGMGVDLGSINETSIENLTELLVDIFGYEFTIEEVAQESADFIAKKQYEATFVLEGNKKVKRGSDIYRDEQERLAALWWSITRHAATVIALERERSLVDSWTSVFRALGIDFVYDPEYGIIHRAEPAQVVSFSNNSKSLQSVNIEQNEKARDVPDFPVFKFIKERGKDFLITADLEKRKYQRQAFSEGSTLVLPTVKEFHIEDVELSETRLKVIQIGERYGRVRRHYLLVYHEESRRLFNIQATQEYWTVFQPSRRRLEQRELGKDRELADYANIPSNVVLERLSLAMLGGDRIPPDEGYNFLARDCTIDNLIIDDAIEPLGTPANNIFTRCTITNVRSRYKSDFIDYSFVSCFFDNTDFSESNLSAFSLEDCSFGECIYSDYTIWPDGFDPKEHVGLEYTRFRPR